MKTERVTVSIYGLGCGGGRGLAIERALARLDGVSRAYVNSVTETAYVEYDAERADPRHFVAVVERLGFCAGEPILR